MWVAEVDTGLKGATGTPRAYLARTQPWRDPMNTLTFRFRETKTIGPGSGQGPASDSCVTLGK